MEEKHDDSSPVEEREKFHKPLGRERFNEIEEKLGYSFSNPDVLERALTHRSAHSGGVSGDYERLEFLGDAVLDLAVAHLLLDQHPGLREGHLSKMRAALVNTSSLAGVAREIRIGPFIRLSRGELANRGSTRPSILADVFEAIFGAIYRESGYQAALDVAMRLFEEKVKDVTPVDPKTELQERLHSLNLEPPTYVLDVVEGPEHEPSFVSSVLIGEQCMGRGRGTTKKASQQAAAAQALEALEEPLREIEDAEGGES